MPWGFDRLNKQMIIFEGLQCKNDDEQRKDKGTFIMKSLMFLPLVHVISSHLIRLWKKELRRIAYREFLS